MSALAKQAAPESFAVTSPMEMVSRAIELGNVEVVGKMLEYQERWDKMQARKAFDVAIAEAKAKIKPVVRNRAGHNSKKYADFAAIASSVDPILASHGLSYRFRSETREGINVTCILSHKGGHYEETTLTGPPDKTGNKNEIQAIGSTLTYLQRYSLVQMLGLAAADDDNGSAGGTEKITEQQAMALVDLLEASGKSREKFLKWARVDRVEDIPASHYQSCIVAIKGAQ